MTHEASPTAGASPTPKDGLRGLVENVRHDLVAGFLVFLVALPLCLGISIASGFPPVAGLLTAIVGGLVVTPLMGAPMTIKGPAAGLIVIALGAVEELGRGDAARGYRLALATIVVASVVQIGLGLARAGRLGDFFPSSAVHGMLAAIGIIIAGKQVHAALGVKAAAKDTLGLLAEIPHSVVKANHGVALIGVVSLALLFGWPMLKAPWAKRVPAPLLVLTVAVPLGIAFDLTHPHHYEGWLGSFDLDPNFLVSVPRDLSKAVVLPDFSELGSATSIKYIVMFSLVGSLESLLSAKAVDALDPWRRTSALDRDLVAVGVGNLVAGMIGGLPMIAEIVRSSANVNNGARTRWSNLFHGVFLLAVVALIPDLVHRIPLAALAAMLVYTGMRLASPRAFVDAYRVSKGALLVFVGTVAATLATDLLVGIAVGVLLEGALHLSRRLSPSRLLRADVSLDEREDHVVLRPRGVLAFSNYLGLRGHVERLAERARIVLDLRDVEFVDHTVMERLHELVRQHESVGRKLSIEGLEGHERDSAHPLAARFRRRVGEELA